MDQRSKKIVKAVAILLIGIFLLWNFYLILFSGFIGGCPPGYDVEKVRYDPDNPRTIPPSNVHLTDEDLASRPYLREVFGEKKRLILPIGAVTDFIPGSFFGPEYATHRIPLSDRDFFVNNIQVQGNTIWEYNGTYIRFRTLLC